jgi:hypothetical protein
MGFTDEISAEEKAEEKDRLTKDLYNGIKLILEKNILDQK